MQRSRLLAGDYRPITFATKPYGCDPGATYVLNWRQESRTHDGGDVFVIPKAPLRWLTVTRVVRRTDGGWLVRFDVTDHRDSERYLRALPPVMTPGQKSSGDGREESYYQSTRFGSPDSVPAVRRDYQEVLTKRSEEFWRETELMRKVQRLADAEKRSQPLRLAEAKRQARLKGIDVSTDERVIQERIERIERKVAREDKADEAA